MYTRFDIDPTREPILVYPTLHYQNGGVVIDAQGWTGVPGLYAAGEVEGGVHGKNRLMGNSLLDFNVFGRRAGIAAAAWARQVTPGRPSLDHVDDYVALLRSAGDPEALLLQLAQPGFHQIDQWQAQILAGIQLRADVALHSKLVPELVESLSLRPIARLQEELDDIIRQLGARPAVAILPDGPLTIPYLT